MSREQSKGTVFHGGRCCVGRAVLNKRPLEPTWESHIPWLLIDLVVTVSHWLDCSREEKVEMVCFLLGSEVVKQHRVRLQWDLRFPTVAVMRASPQTPNTMSVRFPFIYFHSMKHWRTRGTSNKEMVEFWKIQGGKCCLYWNVSKFGLKFHADEFS